MSEGSKPDLGFPRACRLTTRKQYLAVYREGRRARCSTMTMFGVSNEVGFCRVGITVTRKVGNAVQRNHIKRRFREIFRQHRRELTPSIDVVINAYPGIDYDDSATIERDFLACFARLARRIAR